eukprot:11520472-Prorocentrum_lima.AAC.1
MAYQSQDNLRILEEAEEVLVEHKSYQTCPEYGDKQEEYYTMDFIDMLTEDLRLYNVCRAKTGETATGHCNCGLAFPAKMWKQGLL